MAHIGTPRTRIEDASRRIKIARKRTDRIFDRGLKVKDKALQRFRHIPEHRRHALIDHFRFASIITVDPARHIASINVSGTDATTRPR